ncbi:MAG: hypothetical protein GQF41_4496 [Candidatus Rifleibacterium amylolyticum]|nr:MAG: hypothetical protein GQF41_4496 [Candidatus Rifleibacterium amylolyticum]
MPEQLNLESFSKQAFRETIKASDEWERTGTAYLLPKSRMFRRIIEICFWTSHLQEEGRAPKFKLLFCENGQLNSLLNEASQYGNYYQFAKPLEGVPSEILKAASAVSHSRSVICVTTNPRGNRLLIHGLLNVGSLREKFFLNDSTKGVILPRCLICSSNAPGRVTIYLGDQGIIGFDRGISFVRNIDLHTSPMMKTVFSSILNELKENLPEQLLSDPFQLNFFAEVYVHIIDEIILNIFQRRHGGILLLIPENSISQAKQELKQRYSLKHKNIWDEILAFINRGASLLEPALFKERLRRFHASFSESSIADHESGLNMMEVITRLREFTDFVASLSQVDGALVLTNTLRIVGYGTEIRVNDKDLPATFIQQEEMRKPIDPQIFGTRHRSTLRFCRKFPSALGFVFSQDGGIKAVRGQADEVTIIPEVNWIRFEFFV